MCSIHAYFKNIMGREGMKIANFNLQYKLRFVLIIQVNLEYSPDSISYVNLSDLLNAILFYLTLCHSELLFCRWTAVGLHILS